MHEPDVLDEESKGRTRQHRRIDRVCVSAELATAVAGVYTIPIGRSDHKGVVLQLQPEEDTGMSRRTIPVEIIKMGEFQRMMQKELNKIEVWQGDKWWKKVEELAHSISAEMKNKQKEWTGSMWQMEEALSGASIRRLTGAAKKVLAEEGVSYDDTRHAYQQLHKVVNRQRKQRRRQQLLDRVKEAIKEERDRAQEGTNSRGGVKKRRGAHINKLLQQMM